jgi:tetratricopeptide (TPR) repeat protein
VQQESGNVQDAAATAQHAFDVASGTYAPTSIELGDYMNRVARAQLALGNYPRAEQLYRESLAIREKGGRPRQPCRLPSRSAGLRASPCSPTTTPPPRSGTGGPWPSGKRVFGPDHPQVANDVFNLGLISYRRRDFKSAVELYTRALHDS